MNAKDIDPEEVGNHHTAKQRVAAASWALMVVLSVVLVGMLCLLVYLAVIDHQRIRQNERIQDFIVKQAKQNGQYGEQLQDCVQPGGKCYERSQRQTAGVVATINEVSTAAAFCAGKLSTIDQPLTETEFEQFTVCVRNHVTIKRDIDPAKE